MRMTEPPSDSIGMEHEDRDTRLRRVITQCYTRRWITESPNGGILGLPTTIIIIVVGILYTVAGAIVLSRESTVLGWLLVVVPVPLCAVEIFWRNSKLRDARYSIRIDRSHELEHVHSSLDSGMILSPWTYLMTLIVLTLLNVYILVFITAVPSKPVPSGLYIAPMIWVVVVSNIGARFWIVHRATRRVHSGRCIFCEFAVQPDLATPVPLNAAYSSARCSDCGHYVPIVVVPTAAPPEIAQP
ncbi:MAG: hypothetical protein K2W85_11275 [Phycisphaerales bacterium]|nr:hypothetical protein [Phycisphaerales bacterium]